MANLRLPSLDLDYRFCPSMFIVQTPKGVLRVVELCVDRRITRRSLQKAHLPGYLLIVAAGVAACIMPGTIIIAGSIIFICTPFSAWIVTLIIPKTLG